MNHFRPVALEHASRLINHGPTVLITSAHGGHRNVMAAAWSMPVEFTPPRIAVVIDKKTFTRELVTAAGAFALCVPGAVLADATFAVGCVSGREVPDKLARFGLTAQPGPVLGMPVIEEGCCAWMECRLIPERHTEEAYDTCFAEVLAAAADERVFRNGRWAFSDAHADLHTLHHLGAGAFAVAGRTVQARSLA
jgi:flavin reductase (DIM6/NTAB) family NADH-FMN oxidoreductase RutF